MTFFTELKTAIGASRPNIKDVSVQLYANNVNKLSKLYHNKPVESLEFLHDKSKIMGIIGSKKPNTQKTYLASIVVALMAKQPEPPGLTKHYRDLMEAIAKEEGERSKKQIKTAAQQKNWATLGELNAELNRQRKAINKKKLWTQPTLSKKEFDVLQRYVVGSLYLADDANPPLRSDYGNVQLICPKDFGALPATDRKKNHLVIQSRNRKFFHLGDYKTAKVYGEKRIKIGSKLNTILNKWLKVNTSGHLLLNKVNRPMTSNQLTKFMPKVFENIGKKIGISLLRHIYISEKFPAQLLEKEKTADLMAHSVNTQAGYSKK